MPPKRQFRANTLKGNLFAGSGVSNWTQDQNRVAREVMAVLQVEGLTKAGAAGFVGNWMQESGLNPTEAGGYLAQWIGNRFSSLQSYAKSIGKQPTDVEAQTRFAAHELKTQYPSLLAFLSKTNDPAAAAQAISNQYERPGDPQLANRIRYARQAFGITGAGFGVQGPSTGAGPDTGGAATAPSAESFSLFDLVRAPISSIGGWLAQIAFNLGKNIAIGVYDDVIIPWWHWNQRAVDAYNKNMNDDKTGMTVIWNATFWGLGYWLLFTDPDSKSLKAVPVRQSRLAKHARFAQSLPARRSLIKPKDVKGKTPKKPKPVTSVAFVRHVDTMTTLRPEHVRVQSSARGNVTRSQTAVERAGTRERTSESTSENERNSARSEPNAEHRAGSRSLQNRGGDTNGTPGPRERSGTKP